MRVRRGEIEKKMEIQRRPLPLMASGWREGDCNGKPFGQSRWRLRRATASAKEKERKRKREKTKVASTGLKTAARRPSSCVVRRAHTAEAAEADT